MKSICTCTKATFITAGGEKVSYQEIFESIRKSVEIYGKKAGRPLGPEALEDLFQDAVEKALRYHKSFDPGKAQAKTWASRIAANCQTDAYVAHMTRSTRFVPMVSKNRKGDEYILPEAESFGAGAEAWRGAETNEAVERIEKAMDSLNENYRFIISLHLEGLKPKDMAQLIDCTADAAATLLCRARKALKKALGRTFLDGYGIAA